MPDNNAQGKGGSFPCEYCMYYEYDEEFDDYDCVMAADMDEDDYARFVTARNHDCGYFRPGNEYQIVKHQI